MFLVHDESHSVQVVGGSYAWLLSDEGYMDKISERRMIYYSTGYFMPHLALFERLGEACLILFCPPVSCIVHSFL
jgi:hypothetical protein